MSPHIHVVTDTQHCYVLLLLSPKADAQRVESRVDSDGGCSSVVIVHMFTNLLIIFTKNLNKKCRHQCICIYLENTTGVCIHSEMKVCNVKCV